MSSNSPSDSGLRRRNVTVQEKPRVKSTNEVPTTNVERILLTLAILAFSLLFGSFFLAVFGHKLGVSFGPRAQHTSRGPVLCSSIINQEYSCPVTKEDVENMKEFTACGLPDSCQAGFAKHDTWAHVRMVNRLPTIQVVNYTKSTTKNPKRTLMVGPTGSHCALPVQNISIVSMDPVILVIDGFLTRQEAEHVKSIGTPLLGPSGQFHADENAKANHDPKYRTSSTAYLQKSQDNIVSCIEQRASDFTAYPVVNMEALQFLRYEIGQEYKWHYDYFPKGYALWDAEVAAHGQRAVTMFLYLNDLPDEESGGETAFKELKIKVKPKAGRAVFWYDLHADGEGDIRTFHAGLPVLKGTKFAMNVWIRDRPMPANVETVHNMYWWMTTGLKRLLTLQW